MAPIVNEMRTRVLIGLVLFFSAFLVSPPLQAADRTKLVDGWELCLGEGCPDNPMTSLSVGASFSCGVVDSAVWCWNGESIWRVRLGPARRVTVGQDHACVLRRNDTVACWGSSSRGQLNTTSWTGVVDVLAAHSTTCAILKGGRVECVGWALGDGWSDAQSPVRMEAPAAKRFLPTGFAGVCVSTVKGIWCHSGQDDALDITNGYGAVVSPVDCDPACGRVVFRPLTYGKNAKGGATGQYMGCLTGKKMKCWDSSDDRLEPTDAGLRKVTSVGLTDDYGCAVSKARVFCWSDSVAKLVDLSFSSHSFRSVHVGWQVAALAKDGDVWVWSPGGEPVQWTLLN